MWQVTVFNAQVKECVVGGAERLPPEIYLKKKKKKRGSDKMNNGA